MADIRHGRAVGAALRIERTWLIPASSKSARSGNCQPAVARRARDATSATEGVPEVDDERAYLAARFDEGHGGNGISYEIGRHGAADLEQLAEWVRQVDADVESVAASADPIPERIDADSWEAAAQLVERHPHLVIIETHQGGGTADALTFFDRDQPSWNQYVSLNREGSAHIAPFTDHGNNTRMWRRFWSAWQEAPAAALSELEARAALSEPLPTTTAASQVYRVITDTLARAGNVSSARWECRNALEYTTGYGGDDRAAWFDGFDHARRRSTLGVPGDYDNEPGFRFWFILADRQPVACLETTGRIWTAAGAEYEVGVGTAASSLSEIVEALLEGQ